MGNENWENMFVSKVMRTNLGQCNSLPRYYLILAEELEAEANLALAPNHSYIVFKNDEGHLKNIELSSKMITTNAFVSNSAFINANALANKLYMQPLDKRQLLSKHYVDLTLGYISKYGYSPIVAEMLNKALEIDKNNISAKRLSINYAIVNLEYIMHQYGISKEEIQKIQHIPQAMELYNSIVEKSKEIDRLGYKPMPKELYEKWLKSLDNFKNKQQTKKEIKQLEIKMIKTIKD